VGAAPVLWRGRRAPGARSVSEQFQHTVVLFVMSVLVALFAWIYFRDRQPRTGLWMIGWIAILIRFAGLLLVSGSRLSERAGDWLAYSTLIVAGTSFYFSVSKACVAAKMKGLFLLVVAFPSVLYWTGMFYDFHHPWFYRVCLAVAEGSGGAFYFATYKPGRLSGFAFIGYLVFAGGWVGYKAGQPGYGMAFLLFSFFAVTGILYARHHHRWSPGVVLTSVSFLAWGSGFPLAELLQALHTGPGGGAVLWDIPKYFVAFGMILTLFENQVEVATGMAAQYRLEIGERKRAEQAAKQANEAKSVFLATMSHEIRTPLNGVIGITDLVLGTELTPEQRNDLNHVKSSANVLLHVINDILDFSKIEAGKLEFEEIRFDLPEWLDGIVKTMEYRAQEKGLGLSWAVAGRVPRAVIGYPGRLHQVLLNLAGNAIKFTTEGEVGVYVDADSTAPDHVWLHFRVRDTGIGISPEARELVFEAFTQGDSSTTRKFGGTGLGLAIARRLVEMMQGKIWIEGGPDGRGTIFHFTARLGLEPAHAAEAAEPVPLSDSGEQGGTHCATLTGAAGRPGPWNILLAEDNAVNQVLAVRLLEKQHHQVTVVSNGNAAVDAARHGNFDLVLMDVEMPEKDGLEATRDIREWEHATGAHVPIIAMTASAIKGDEELCLRAGMDAYISKPINPQKLMDLIASTIPALPVCS